MTESAKAVRPPSTVFHAITVVWGREYLETFLNVCLPNQLAPGNVPALPPGSRYRILTSRHDLDEVNAHPMVRALRKIVPVDVVVVEALDRRDSTARGYELMIACHRQAVSDALDARAALIFLSADVIFSDGSLAALVRRHREGYRAVVNTGLRLAKESFLECFETSGADVDALSGRELVRLALPHLHSHTQSMFADAQRFSKFPVAVYWRIGHEGLLARAFHLHPLMVDPIVPVLPKRTIDGRYLELACPDATRVHVVSDSDELQMFELTTSKRSIVARGGSGASVWRAAAVAAVCDDLQVGYWRDHPIRLHAGNFDERWSAAAADADLFAGNVLRLRRYGRAARRGFRFLERARQRIEQYRKASRRRLPRVAVKHVTRPVRVAAHRCSRIFRKTLQRATRRARWVRAQ